MSKQMKQFHERLARQRPLLRRFLTKLSGRPPKDLDASLAAIEPTVWAETDCLSCSNCCRTMSPTYTDRDLKRISRHLQMTEEQFKAKWLYRNREGDWMNKKQPCQFLNLDTHLCSIYAIRPADCAGFPHLVKKPARDYLHVHHQNLQHCPATLRLVEKLMEKMQAVVQV